MVPPHTTLELVHVIRAIVMGTSNLEDPLAMDFSMAYGHPASHNENYIFLVARHREGSLAPLEQDRLLCYVGLRRDTCIFLLDDRVWGTPLWVLALHPPPRDLPSVPCRCRYIRSYYSFPNLGRLS
jgi:hypothetical protein